MSSSTIAILGFGAFGRLSAQLLSPRVEVLVCDPSAAAQEQARELGLRVISAENIWQADIVVLAMPVPALGFCLRRIAPHLRKGQIVIDVCSVKEEPVRLMQTLLPEDVEILGTHPMFGPQSAKRGVGGLQIVVCPVRGRQWRCIVRFLRNAVGLRVILTTAEEHDRQAAVTQGLTHLLARAVETLGSSPVIRTRSFGLLMEGLAMVRDDAPEIYEAVVHGNRHVAPVRDHLIRALSEDTAQRGTVFTERAILTPDILSVGSRHAARTCPADLEFKNV